MKSEKIIRALFLLALYAAVVVAVMAIAFVNLGNMQEQTRGVTFGAALREPAPLGVNVSLEQYSNDDEVRALALIRDGGFRIIRQHLFWSDIEPSPGEFQWTKWDRIVAHAREYGLDLIAVLDTTPTWARDPGEADLVNAAPARLDDYARFVQAFVRRYGDSAGTPSWHLYVQLWDNPNVHPFWGRRNADPFEYAALLRAGAKAARSANPGIKILSAGLAPNDQLIRGHPSYSDVLFLRGMYEAGARDYFDILGAKPYGMWSGPEDRRVSENVFNFSRVILLRDEMVAHGDAGKPVWAVEFGWNALPQGWEGKPSPWGTDAEEVQAVRLVQAVQRARSEWSWMGPLLLQTFQPNAPSNDPLWGFALVDKDMRPRGLFGAATNAMTASLQPATFDLPRFYATLALLAFIGAVAAWRGKIEASRVPWAEGWSVVATRFALLPETVQFILLVAGVLAFYYSRNTVLNFVVLGVIVFLFALRLDLGLAITLFTVPFYLFPKNLIGSMQFSLVEVLTLAAVVAWALRQIVIRRPPTNDGGLLTADRGRPGFAGPGSAVLLLRSAVSRLTPLDWSVVFFVLIGLVSIRVASSFGVASREFRVIVVEPALLYGLVRASNLAPRDLQRLVDAFVLSALAVSLIGLYQFLFTNYVIVAEGVRRVLAVYGSPNNLALFLERALPLVLALALYVEERRRRVAYALAAVLIALCIYLTYSRGAWLLGLPAALLFVGLLSGRRARLAIVGLIVVGAVALIPFMGTERFRSFLETGTGTGFFRVSVWESGLVMLRDHPVFGVGLDNFLYEYPKYANPDAWREPNLSHPHNFVLDFWLRMGVLGMGVMIWMVVQFYTRGMRALQFKKSRALAVGLMAGMTAALTHGMIDATYFYVDLAFVWMMMLGIMGRLGIGGAMATSMEELRVLRTAEEISDSIWEQVIHWDEFAKDTVGKQIARAADSIGANIAEAYGRFHFGQKIEFLYYSRGSLFEAKYWLNRAAQRHLFPPSTVEELNSYLTGLARQLNAYVKNLKVQQVGSSKGKTAREEGGEYQFGLVEGDLFDKADLEWLESPISNLQSPISILTLVFFLLFIYTIKSIACGEFLPDCANNLRRHKHRCASSLLVVRALSARTSVTILLPAATK